MLLYQQTIFKLKKAIQTKILNVIDRPKNLSGDNVSDYKVIKHAINNLKKPNTIRYYLNVTTNFYSQEAQTYY